VERILATQPDLEIVATCGDYETLRAAVERERPDVVLTDIRMPPTRSDEGIRLAAELAVEAPQVGVVVLSQYDEPEYVLACSRPVRSVGRTCSRKRSPTWTSSPVRSGRSPPAVPSSTRGS
jgi:DNA-binding NarL/FixJ family response regulator